MATLAELVRAGSRTLEQAGWDTSSAWLDAEAIARGLLRRDLTEWLTRQHEAAAPAFHVTYDAAIARRTRHEPVAYITGERDFYGRSFAVSPAVLIPRPETELVVEQALRALSTEHPAAGQFELADVGTGSGILAITLALELVSCRVMATDLSEEALRVARTNVDRFGAADRVSLRHASLLGAGEEPGAGRAFDLIVSNPPYVAERDGPSLMPDVRDYEPALALFGGTDGFAVIRRLLPAACQRLRAGGWLVMEIGAGQSEPVSQLVSASGLALERVVNDLAGIPRVVVARAPGAR